jgi:hypothetical protein
MHPGPPLPSYPAHAPQWPRSPVFTAPRLSAAPLVAALVPLLLLHMAPAPAPYWTLLDPIFLSLHHSFKGSWSPSCRPFTFSPSSPFRLRVKLVAAHYTPPHCLLSKPGNRSIPEAVGCHRPPAAKVLASMSRSGRPPVPLSR